MDFGKTRHDRRRFTTSSGHQRREIADKRWNFRCSDPAAHCYGRSGLGAGRFFEPSVGRLGKPSQGQAAAGYPVRRVRNIDIIRARVLTIYTYAHARIYDYGCRRGETPRLVGGGRPRTVLGAAKQRRATNCTHDARVSISVLRLPNLLSCVFIYRRYYYFKQ